MHGTGEERAGPDAAMMRNRVARHPARATQVCRQGGGWGRTTWCGSALALRGGGGDKALRKVQAGRGSRARDTAAPRRRLHGQGQITPALRCEVPRIAARTRTTRLAKYAVSHAYNQRTVRRQRHTIGGECHGERLAAATLCAVPELRRQLRPVQDHTEAHPCALA